MRESDSIVSGAALPAWSILTRRPITYEQFQQLASDASREIAETEPHRRGVVPIPRLRRALPYVPFATFNQHLLRMERNGLVHLIPPGDPTVLSDEARRDSLLHPSGELRSFLLWISPRVQTTPSFWD